MSLIATKITVEKEIALAMQDLYFKQYQKTGDKQDFENYNQYLGQETAYQKVLDIMGVNKNDK